MSKIVGTEWLDTSAGKLRDGYGQHLWTKYTSGKITNWQTEEHEAKLVMPLYDALSTTARFLYDGFPERTIQLKPIAIEGKMVSWEDAGVSMRHQLHYLKEIGIQGVQAVKKKVGDHTKFDLGKVSHQAVLRADDYASTGNYWIVQKGEHFINLIDQKLEFLFKKQQRLTSVDMRKPALALERIMFFMDAFGEPDVGSTMPRIYVIRPDMIKVTPNSVTVTLTPTTLCWALEPILIPGTKYLIEQVVPKGVTVKVGLPEEIERELQKRDAETAKGNYDKAKFYSDKASELLIPYHFVKRVHQWRGLKSLLEAAQGNQTTFLRNWQTLMEMGIALGSVNSRPGLKENVQLVTPLPRTDRAGGISFRNP